MHAARRVLEAIVAAVSDLPTTGRNVHTARDYRHSRVPALSIRIGSITPLENLSQTLIDSEVVVEVHMHVNASPREQEQGDNDLDAQILRIDAETWRAIMADQSQGGTAINTTPAELSIVSQAEGEKPTAEATRRYRLHIRHSYTDPES